MSSIGAALYGVSRQAQDFFDADYLKRATIIYNNLQLFVKSIGVVNLRDKGEREILVVLLTDNDVNIGVLILQMNRFAAQIREVIKKSQNIKKKLKLNEHDYKKVLEEFAKGEIFSKQRS